MLAMETTDGLLNRFGRSLDTVKEMVLIEQVASEYGEFKLLGNGRLLGRCLSPEHTDRTPSMTVFTDAQRFKCFGCGVRGDVLDLEMLAGRHEQLWTAMVALSARYGITLPERPDGWEAWQDEKERRRDQLRQVRARLYQRRMFRLFFADQIAAIEDPEDREREAHKVWAELWPVAWGWAA